MGEDMKCSEPLTLENCQFRKYGGSRGITQPTLRSLSHVCSSSPLIIYTKLWCDIKRDCCHDSLTPQLECQPPLAAAAVVVVVVGGPFQFYFPRHCVPRSSFSPRILAPRVPTLPRRGALLSLSLSLSFCFSHSHFARNDQNS